MADFASPGGNSDGIAFLVSAGIVYEIIAAACSSPQTTEINAKARSATLMKWVKLGLYQAALFVVLAAAWDKRHRAAIVTGGGLAAGLMWWQYDHANKAGLASTEPGTEQY
jgi:hypothetical protein